MEPIFKQVIVNNDPSSEPKPLTKTNSYVDGECIWFHENGSISEIANFLMGTLHGENVVYSEDGDVRSYAHYSYGVLTASSYKDSSILNTIKGK